MTNTTYTEYQIKSAVMYKLVEKEIRTADNLLRDIYTGDLLFAYAIDAGDTAALEKLKTINANVIEAHRLLTECKGLIFDSQNGEE